MTNHIMMSVIKLIALLQVPFKKLAKSRVNVVVRIALNNKEVFLSIQATSVKTKLKTVVDHKLVQAHQ